MPFHADAVRIDLTRGPDADGHSHGRSVIWIRAGVLRRLGLHPDQPTSKIAGPSPPAWWHAAAERAAWPGR
jgi:hypothetical protein